MTAMAESVQRTGRRDVRQFQPIFAGLAVALAGSSGFFLVPMVVAALRHQGVTETWIGLIGSADPAGMFLGAVLALFGFVRAKPRRSAQVAMVVALAANAGSLMIDTVGPLLILRILAGAAGGVAFAVGLTALSRSRFPDRCFALLSLMQMVFGVTVAALGDAGTAGLHIIYQCMFVLQILGLACAFLLDRTLQIDAKPTQHDARPSTLSPILVGYTGIANFLYAGGFLLLWSNIQSAAAAAGLSPGSAVLVINVGLAGGLAGALFTLSVDGRGRRRLIAGSLFAFGLAGIALIGLSGSMPLFLVGTFLLQFSGTAAFYGFGAVSEADGSGRLPIIHILAVKAGFGMAPMVASSLMDRHGIAAVNVLAFFIMVVAMLLYQLLIATAARAAACRR